jgi:hypothetical protein
MYAEYYERTGEALPVHWEAVPAEQVKKEK